MENFDQDNNRNNLLPWIIGIIVVLCCLCAILIPLVGYMYYKANPTETPTELIPGATLELLEKTIVPANEPKELACRLQGICDVPDVITTSAAPRKIGDQDQFWVSDRDTAGNNQVTATLRYVTPHVYFWVQNDVDYDESEMKALVDAFENKIYPTDREFFGEEWQPGIDGDAHIYILYARGLGSNIAGYFSSSDSIHPAIKKYSNGHEMFLFNADNTPLNEESTYGILAHEFQHMIHWNQDLNETSWINEGSAELAVFLNGYDIGVFDWLYISDPDLQLNDWPNDQGATRPHYGAGFLFMTYFLDRFGEDATQALVKDPANGLDSVEDVLREINATDPVTNQPIYADDLFMDWAVTNLVLDPAVGDGRYVYHNYSGASQAQATETISDCPQTLSERDVHQYGVDYIKIDCAGDYTLSFSGSTLTGLLPVDPNSGTYAFWTNKGDESDIKLTREFDFTNVSAPIELKYHTWYDIETDWDYAYVLASEDGKTWQILKTPSGTDTNPSGNSYGWGYTGNSGNWIEESVDLSAYAGKKISVRFEYVTDAAVNGEGLLLDDVSVDAINYATDFETDDGGWVAEGFARVQNALPQTFRLALFLKNDSSVKMIPVSPEQTAEIPLTLKAGEEAYLIISGTTRYTRELGFYQVEIK
ncbi:MAG: immune inhibitor A [Anaerolineales bacterium]|nr:immune inhibitor A [Anaerolineales bacterium]